MKQFYDMKESYPDCILFFRMGDFYEMFGEDAIVASAILGLQLTSRNKNAKNSIPLCGIPHHSYESYLRKLIQSGKKVAICEQLEDPREAIGVVKRGVVKVVTASTDLENMDATSFDNNFLLSITHNGNNYITAVADVSTGELYLKSVPTESIVDFIERLSPKEIISNKSYEDLNNYNFQVKEIQCNKNRIKDSILNHFDITTTDSYFIDDDTLLPTYMILSYLDDLIISTKLSLPKILSDDKILILDSIAVKTLDLVPSKDKNNKSLFDILNKCSTTMGARYLKSAILNPLRDATLINMRYSIIEKFISSYDMTDTIHSLLDKSIDLYRVATKIITGTILPKELIALRSLLLKLPEISAILNSILGNDNLNLFLDPIEDLSTLIGNAMNDNPSNKVGDGSIIRYGYNSLMDEILDLKKDVDIKLATIEQKEREASGIGQLKIGYNKVFGYYIEVSKGNVNRVPTYFERKQTLVNAERFFTTELKILETDILSADDRLSNLEKDLYNNIKTFASCKIDIIRKIATSISELDFLISLAIVAKNNSYCRPTITDDYNISIKDCRHPIVEQAQNSSSFIPNDFDITNSNNLMIITGPNMSGKSTYLRSVAISVVMAHMGSFVPASSCTMSLVDRVFTRIGAHDNISKGESTFMVEMIESANILRNATDRSLIILDELGRGTSTYDGISLATAIANYILERIKAKTLFTTHYHELTTIADMHSNAECYKVDIKEWKDEIIFLHKVVKGASDRSYGIYVAKLASLPDEVIVNANRILKTLEEHRTEDMMIDNNSSIVSSCTFAHDKNTHDRDCDSNGTTNLIESSANNKIGDRDSGKASNISSNNNSDNINYSNSNNLNNYNSGTVENRAHSSSLTNQLTKDKIELLDEIKNLDINNLSPMDALNLLLKYKKMVL